MAKTFDGPPTLERSGSEHRRAVISLALLERARAWEWVKDPPPGEGQVGQKTTPLPKKSQSNSKVHTFQSPHKLNSFLLFLIFPELRKKSIIVILRRRIYVLQHIFCNNTLCICSNGTICKLIVIFICLN